MLTPWPSALGFLPVVPNYFSEGVTWTGTRGR
jgi:hypothetical protein